SDATNDSASTAIYYNGLFDVPNPDHALRISMTAEVTIVLDEARNVLTVPARLVTRKGADGGVMVMVYDPATQETHPQRIEVGLNNNITAQVIAGLEEGQQVVSGGLVTVSRPAGGQGQSRMGGPGGGGPMIMMR